MCQYYQPCFMPQRGLGEQLCRSSWWVAALLSFGDEEKMLAKKAHAPVHRHPTFHFEWMRMIDHYWSSHISFIHLHCETYGVRNSIERVVLYMIHVHMCILTLHVMSLLKVKCCEGKWVHFALCFALLCSSFGGSGLGLSGRSLQAAFGILSTKR